MCEGRDQLSDLKLSVQPPDFGLGAGPLMEPQTPAEMRAAWEHWLSDRPQGVKDFLAKMPPWNLYRLSTTGQIVLIRVVDEDKESGELSVRVDVLFEHNPTCVMERQVFGINPDNLSLHEKRPPPWEA